MTVDPHLIRAGNEAVTMGMADSLSGWVNDALADKVAHERRREGMAKAVAAYEAEFGEITEEQMDDAVRRSREKAVVVRGSKRRKAS